MGFLLLAFPEEQEQERNHEAYEHAGCDGSVKSEIFPAYDQISRQTSKEWNFVRRKQNGADCSQNGAYNQK
jgi:hypothetical protein